ncbi:hypothetical protein LCGC14_0615950 [marine sediment metagenome]|uniref:Phage head morphogenesis domain-containing protein n=1 Tax=marine sediment metagenome TaxID=412755 RepID=A0A0F9TSL6_9ZZZZ
MAAPRRQTQIDVRRKRTAELQLHTKLVRFNTKVVRSVEARYRESGSVLDVTGTDDISQMLAPHYRKVGNIFKDDIRGVLPKAVGITREESAIVNRTLSFHYGERVDDQSQRILRTTQKNIEQAIGRAQRDHPTASRGQVAGVAGANLERMLAGRSHGISIYETQWSAEFAKLVEAAVLLGDETDLELKAAGEKKIKIWDSLGDSRVRVGAFNHLRADGQARLPDKPFDVSGEKLLFPGDLSLGASQGNIQRCRCSAYYDRVAIAKIRKGRVKREDLGAIAPEGAETVGATITVPLPPGFTFPRPKGRTKKGIKKGFQTRKVPIDKLDKELANSQRKIDSVEKQFSSAFKRKDTGGQRALQTQLERLKKRHQSLLSQTPNRIINKIKKK